MLDLAVTFQRYQIYYWVWSTVWKVTKVCKKCPINWQSYFSSVKTTDTWTCSKRQEFFIFLQNLHESTCVGVSFLIKVSGWRLEACVFIKIDSSIAVCLSTLHIFLRTSIRPNTYERLLLKLEILKSLLIQFIKKYSLG